MAASLENPTALNQISGAYLWTRKVVTWWSVTMHGDAETRITVVDATSADLAELADVAARTFPLACPPTVPAGDITAFIGAHLSRAHFAGYLADPARIVLVAKDRARITGYAVLVAGTGYDDTVRQAAAEGLVVSHPATELSKLYVLADQHGSGTAPLLMDSARRRAAAAGSKCLWLGVNQQNLRAQRFYLKQGFAVAGTRRFQLGAHFEHDYVMVLDL